VAGGRMTAPSRRHHSLLLCWPRVSLLLPPLYRTSHAIFWWKTGPFLCARALSRAAHFCCLHAITARNAVCAPLRTPPRLALFVGRVAWKDASASLRLDAHLSTLRCTFFAPLLLSHHASYTVSRTSYTTHTAAIRTAHHSARDTRLRAAGWLDNRRSTTSSARRKRVLQPL